MIQTHSISPERLVELHEAERLANAGRLGDAETLCRRVRDAEPEAPEPAALLGFLALRHNRFEEACAQLEWAVTRRGDVPQWRLELRQAYRSLYRLEDALREAQAAVRLAPTEARYLHGLSQVHLDRGEWDEAMNCVLDALALAPDDTDVRLSLMHLLLSRGEYRPGWAAYEHRFHAKLYARVMPAFKRPVWNGMRLPGRRLVLAADQGYGDAFQFARYIPMAAERCAGVVVLCRPTQIPVFQRIPGVVACVTDITRAGEHAAYGWLASMPFVFGTELHAVPAATPYLSPDPARKAFWRAELDARIARPGLRVGLVWAGNPENGSDWRRSIRLAQLRDLAAVGVNLVSLQLPVPEADRPDMAAMGLPDLAPDLKDFGETAAVLANLDLLIGVDTGTVHLAGAMGVPTWVLTYQPSDWRWLIGRDDSPWYPSIRLFRQPTAGDWADPIGRVGSALQVLARA